jgi:hypothetical protein
MAIDRTRKHLLPASSVHVSGGLLYAGSHGTRGSFRSVPGGSHLRQSGRPAGVSPSFLNAVPNSRYVVHNTSQVESRSSPLSVLAWIIHAPEASGDAAKEG